MNALFSHRKTNTILIVSPGERRNHRFKNDKPIGASPRRDYRSDEDGTILAHNILHGFDWNIEKGGNAPRAPD